MSFEWKWKLSCNSEAGLNRKFMEMVKLLNIYLNPLDHFIKRTLKTKRYVRYVDDFLMIGISMPEAVAMKNVIDKFISSNLNLAFSKTTIQKLRKGINFVGYRTWKSSRFIRKYSLCKFRKSLIQNKTAAVISLLGHAKWTNSISYMFEQIKEFGDDIINQRSRRLFKVWQSDGWNRV